MSGTRTSTLWRTQNFLRDPRLVEELVAHARLQERDVVYDLGAGTGNLTATLARRAGRVIAIEKDPRLVAVLRRRFAKTPNVVVREADILHHRLPLADYVVVANLPFEITADVLRLLTSAPRPPRDAYLVMQTKAAGRFMGRPRATLAALLIAPWFSLRVLRRFERADFLPPPSVDAVFVRLHKRGPPLVPSRHAQLYRDFMSASFSTRSRTAFGALERHLGAPAARHLFRSAHVDATTPPSRIPVESWLLLYRAFARAPIAVRHRVAGAAASLARTQGRLQKEHRTRAPRDGLQAVCEVRLPPRCAHSWDRTLMLPAVVSGPSHALRRPDRGIDREARGMTRDSSPAQGRGPFVGARQ